MEVEYDGKSYEFDLEEIDLAQATLIQNRTGLTLLKLEEGLREASPAAMRAIFWLMLEQNGKHVNIDNVNFKIVKFANAIQAAYEKANPEEAAKDVPPAKSSGASRA